ncbi:MAG: phosphatidylglycerophosphatase A [Candidatus Paracaedibacteraceae bacterium]|nr:phosphatidylglycerophosphatase A [Candidatus Paracaedibacteraceae bacterium]
MNVINSVSYWIATWFRVGLWPKMPGTWGSLMAMPVAALLYLAFGLKGLMISTLIAFILGAITTYFVLFTTIDADPSFIVIDEVVGQWIVLWVAGTDIRFWFLAFLLFRVFDILKPYPIKRIEKYFEDGSQFSKATGIMVDDIVAAGYSIICLWILKIMFT